MVDVLRVDGLVSQSLTLPLEEGTGLQALLYLLDIAAAPLVVFTVEILPLALHFVVCLHLHMCLSPFISALHVSRDEIGKEERVGSLGTVFGQYAHEQQVHYLGVSELEGSEDVPPSERCESASAAFLAFTTTSL